MDEGTRQIDAARLRRWFGPEPRTAAPEIEGYEQVAHERLDMLFGTIAGFAVIPVAWFVIAVAVDLLGGPLIAGFSVGLLDLLLGLVIALVLVPLLHEAVHGIAALLVGARPAFGVGPGFAYTTFREPLTRVPYLIVGLAPVVVLTIASILLAARWHDAAGLIVFFAVVNASGAVGDGWMAWRILKQPPGALYFDLADGFAVLAPVDRDARGG